MIKKEIVSFLKQHKNLLAFSAGGDSVALFFLLVEHNIPFDIAIVDYGVRKQSKEEVNYAKSLATQFQKECYVYTAPKIQSNFEAKAREIRYSFFQKLIKDYQYSVLLTAHHLGDRLEWFLMQLTKGAGFVELLGMHEKEFFSDYVIVRPLLEYTKEELLAYNKKKQLHFFEDQTNYDTTIKRNFFRYTYAQPLLQKHADGIKRSFAYMDDDLEECFSFSSVLEYEEMGYLLQTTIRQDLVAIDRYFKTKGIVLSRFIKAELKTKKTTIVARKFVVAFYEKYIIITPFVKVVMDKKFKESCRRLQIDPKQRGYFFQSKKSFKYAIMLLKTNKTSI